MSCSAVRICIAVTVRKRTTREVKEANTMKMIDAREISKLMGVSMAAPTRSSASSTLTVGEQGEERHLHRPMLVW